MNDEEKKFCFSVWKVGFYGDKKIRSTRWQSRIFNDDVPMEFLISIVSSLSYFLVFRSDACWWWWWWCWWWWRIIDWISQEYWNSLSSSFLLSTRAVRHKFSWVEYFKSSSRRSHDLSHMTRDFIIFFNVENHLLD